MVRQLSRPGVARRVLGAGVALVLGLAGSAGLGATPPVAAASAPVAPAAPTLEAAGRPSVFAAGNAADLGSTGDVVLSGPLRDLARTPSGRGYWLLGADGGVFAYGDAGFHGSTGDLVLNRPAVAMAPTRSGAGYWFVASDGGVFTFGDASFHGSTGGIPLNAPVVGMVPTATGRGYFLVAADGGVFTFGDATFLGSTGDQRLSAPAVALTAAPDGSRYWLLLEHGEVRAFPGGQVTSTLAGVRAVDIQVTPTGRGYWVLDANGRVYPFGDAARLAPPVALLPGGSAVALAATPDGGGLWVATSGRVRPPGTATAQGPYSFIAADDQGRPGRWDPCGGPIEWYLNAALAPPGGDVVVHEAFDYLEAITGLDFAFAGPTALDPARDRVSGAVVVGWVASLDAAGRGGAAYRVRPTGPVAEHGSVALNATYNAQLTVGWGGGAWGPIVLHELAHVVGLGHVDDPAQLMHPVNTGQADFGSGDLAGLHRLGAAQGCA